MDWVKLFTSEMEMLMKNINSDWSVDCRNMWDYSHEGCGNLRGKKGAWLRMETGSLKNKIVVTTHHHEPHPRTLTVLDLTMAIKFIKILRKFLHVRISFLIMVYLDYLRI